MYVIPISVLCLDWSILFVSQILIGFGEVIVKVESELPSENDTINSGLLYSFTLIKLITTKEICHQDDPCFL